jgi:hypothetical protein
MIRLEYDVPTNGVRVSFVVRDDVLTEARMDGVGGFEHLLSVKDTKKAPETIHNLTYVRELLDAAIEQLEK